MESINFVSGGKTGDLLHSLMVVKSICETKNKKANLYITNISKYGGDNFHFDMHKTYYDLEPFIMAQDYINSFHILYEHDEISNYVNLNEWRNSEHLFKLNWVDILCDKFSLSKPSIPWVTFDYIDNFGETILIHRSEHRHTPDFPWEEIVNKNNCKFITNISTLHEYEMFPFKEMVDLIICESFVELVRYINSCKFFIGNMSTPLAIAHCLGKPHLGELIHPDENHYIGEEKYLKSFYYISNNHSNFTEGINNYINI